MTGAAMFYRIRARRLELETVRRFRRAEAIRATLEGVTIGATLLFVMCYLLAFCGVFSPLI